MLPLSEKSSHIRNSNTPSSYLPVRNKGNEFSWDTITGIVLGILLRKEIKNYPVSAFKEDCEKLLATQLDAPAFWEVLDKMYFSGQGLYKISPLFLLFKAQKVVDGETGGWAASQNVGNIFAGFLNGFQLEHPKADQLNFIEKRLFGILEGRIVPGGMEAKENSYLPYLAQAFRDDMAFLVGKQTYFLAELKNVLKLYAFSYCAQLGLNINSYQAGEPKPRKLYFIFETETASSERNQLNKHGFKSFLESIGKLFPFLTMLENLQNDSVAFKQPLWRIFQECLDAENKDDIIAKLDEYSMSFAIKRELDPPEVSSSIESAFKSLMELTVKQFSDSMTTRRTINEKYVKAIEHKIAAEFIQVRGRAGRVLVLSQDHLLLLTNLAIANSEKLRFQDLLKEFERRGFCVDGQTQQVFIEFYERMGNVERMSDSGDAVYVRKTI